MISLITLEKEGMAIDSLKLPDNFIEYLESRTIEKDNETWSEMNSCNFPDDILAEVINKLGEGLSQSKDHIEVKINKWKKGHSLTPHSDMTIYSPFVAQLFYIIGEENHSGSDLIFGRKNNSKYIQKEIKNGDLLFFYTYPNDFVAAFTKLTSNHTIYVINFYTCFNNDEYKSWIFKDVTMPEWGNYDQSI